MRVVYESNVIYLDQILLTVPNIRIIDINRVFGYANYKFYQETQKLGLGLNFDFSKPNNKRLYTHCFLISICDLIGENSGFRVVLFRNTINMEKNFIDKLVKKTKTIFGFDIVECDMSFDDFAAGLVKDSGELVQKIEQIINFDKKPKTFKHIKRYFAQNGLTYLDDVFFEDIRNKMMIMQ